MADGAAAARTGAHPFVVGVASRLGFVEAPYAEAEPVARRDAAFARGAAAAAGAAAAENVAAVAVDGTAVAVDARGAPWLRFVAERAEAPADAGRLV